MRWQSYFSGAGVECGSPIIDEGDWVRLVILMQALKHSRRAADGVQPLGAFTVDGRVVGVEEVEVRHWLLSVFYKSTDAHSPVSPTHQPMD